MSILTPRNAVRINLWNWMFDSSVSDKDAQWIRHVLQTWSK